MWSKLSGIYGVLIGCGILAGLLATTALDQLAAPSLFEVSPDDKTVLGAASALLYAKLFVPIDLDTASREEILLVPRVGPRMAHEFEEYRPYRALAQFRREIAEYVDDDELARLERYVTLTEP